MPGTCRRCGCSELDACVDVNGDPCGWTDASKTLCTACAAPVYVASSWRNDHQPVVVRALREAGVDCYDFRNPAEGEHGFSWKECGPKGKSDDRGYVHGDMWEPSEIVQTLEHPVARRGFGLDFGAMRRSRACVLVMPCGRSAHIEAGYFVGAARPVHVLLTGPAEPELMWRMAYESGGAIHVDLASVVEALRGSA